MSEAWNRRHLVASGAGGLISLLSNRLPLSVDRETINLERSRHCHSQLATGNRERAESCNRHGRNVARSNLATIPLCAPITPRSAFRAHLPRLPYANEESVKASRAQSELFLSVCSSLDNYDNLEPMGSTQEVGSNRFRRC